jgi:formylmethanofuran dehydrogenase subunit C
VTVSEITLTPKDIGDVPVTGDAISPDALFDKDAAVIGELELWQGNRKVKLKGLFDVEVSGKSKEPGDVKIIITDGVPRVKNIGQSMTAGEIVVKGDVDMHCGADMRGGKITVEGNADGWLGREMRDGTITVEGNASNYVGSAYRGEKRGMRGGTITVKGDVLDFCGERISGGKIEVTGNAGVLTGMQQQGGEIHIHGNATIPGGDMSKGTIVIGGSDELLPTFKENGMQEYGGSKYRKFTGDLAVDGEGVLLVAV